MTVYATDSWVVWTLEPLRNVLAPWPAVLPRALGDPVLPLAVGSGAVLRMLLPADRPEAADLLEHCLKLYVSSTQYRSALAEPGAWRHAPDGAPIEPVRADQAVRAAVQLSHNPRSVPRAAWPDTRQETIT